MINLLIYAIIACVLFVIFYKEETEVMDEVHSNYAECMAENMFGVSHENK